MADGLINHSLTSPLATDKASKNPHLKVGPPKGRETTTRAASQDGPAPCADFSSGQIHLLALA